MSGSLPLQAPLGFDALTASVGLAVATGAAAVAIPSLAALTGALTALAVAAWAARRRRGAPSAPRTAGALLLVGLAGIAFLAPPPGVDPFRSAILGLSTIALWRTDPTRSPPAPRGAS